SRARAGNTPLSAQLRQGGPLGAGARSKRRGPDPWRAGVRGAGPQGGRERPEGRGEAAGGAGGVQAGGGGAGGVGGRRAGGGREGGGQGGRAGREGGEPSARTMGREDPRAGQRMSGPGCLLACGRAIVAAARPAVTDDGA